jgi:hypothetical protein
VGKSLEYSRISSSGVILLEDDEEVLEVITQE